MDITPLDKHVTEQEAPFHDRPQSNNDQTKEKILALENHLHALMIRRDVELETLSGDKDKYNDYEKKTSLIDAKIQQVIAQLKSSLNQG